MTTRSEKEFISEYVVVVDSREQAPFSFTGHRCNSKRQHRPLVVRTTVAGLETGDYSLVGFEKRITIERKSLADAYSTFSQDRDRFERELLRMATYENAHVVIEADWPTLLARRCPECCGLGKSIGGEESEALQVQFTRRQSRKLFHQDFAAALRSLGVFADEPNCERCEGTGTLLPTDHSKFAPKAFFETIVAWKIRFPSVQWELCANRRFAEKTTLRLLERFWRDEEDRVKKSLEV